MKGQSYSLDLVIAVIIFMIVITVFYTLVNKEQEAPERQLQRQGETIAVKLDANSKQSVLNVIESGKINQEQLDVLYNMSYDELKQLLGVTNDFCIYLEDAQGRIIFVGNKSGIGNGNLTVAGVECGAVRS